MFFDNGCNHNIWVNPSLVTTTTGYSTGEHRQLRGSGPHRIEQVFGGAGSSDLIRPCEPMLRCQSRHARRSLESRTSGKLTRAPGLVYRRAGLVQNSAFFEFD